jgi:signal transduction histidine kinase
MAGLLSRPRVSPQTLLATAAAVCALFAGGALVLALGAPALGLRLEAREAGGIQVREGTRTSPPLEAGAVLVAALTPSGRVPLDGELLVDDPDQLDSWERYNHFLARHTALADAAARGTLTLEREDGREVRLLSRPRRLVELPWLFWYQVGVGCAGFLLAAGVLAFRPADGAARHFALSGFGMLVFCCCAAVYSTREFLLDGALVHALSAMNMFGASFFTAALVALLACYPRPLGPFWPLAYVVQLGGWAASVLQWTPGVSWIHIIVLGLFSVTFLLAVVQWWSTRGRPVERAALMWFLLSIYLGTCLFAGAVLLPTALGVLPLVSQGLMFAVFLFMFAGIALGITRYRLFELDRWWFQALSWFLGGVAVILFDFVMAAVLQVTPLGVLGFALAVSGWLYFPLRQAVWSRWRRRAGRERGDRAGQWMLALFSARSEGALEDQWRALLHAEFAPLELLALERASEAVHVSQDGLELTVPAPRTGQAVLLRHPARGSRLFRREDLADAEVLAGMGRRALQAQHEREQGARAERGRLMRDLHDDLGAKLLSLVYRARESETEALARSALRDMRDVLTELEAEPCSLDEALVDWRAEAQGRADALGFTLEWEQEGGAPERLRLSARQRTNIGRILRESITNALKHARAERLRVRAHWDTRGLALSVEDDGAAGPSEPGAWKAGTGTRAIRQRTTDLGGTVDWVAGARGCRVEVRLPLESAAPA